MRGVRKERECSTNTSSRILPPSLRRMRPAREFWSGSYTTLLANENYPNSARVDAAYQILNGFGHVAE